MAIDYKSLRNTLDSGDMTKFRSDLLNSLLQNTVSQSVNAANTTTDLLRTKNLQAVSDSLESYFADFNKYVTNDQSLTNLKSNLSTAITSLTKGATYSSINNLITSTFKASAPKDQTYKFESAALQGGTALDVNGLVDIYNKQGQDAYRTELANRVAAFNTAAGISNTGSAFTGDARFDSNTLGQSIASAQSSLQSIATQTVGDLAASKLASMYGSISGLKYVPNDYSSYLGDAKGITSSLNTLDKTQTTITAETDAKQAFETKRKQLVKQAGDSGSIGVLFNNSLSTPISTDSTTSTLGQSSTYGKA